MIRNENEYARALERIEREKARLAVIEEQYRAQFSEEDQVQALMEPLLSFHGQLLDEIKVYERLRRGDLGDLTNLHGLGRLLIHIRISRGISQRDLAESLDVHESQVSRDERNEYHGVTLERASRILDALGAKVLTSVAEPVTATHADAPPSWLPPKTRPAARTSEQQSVQPENLTPSQKVSNADFASAA
jgi:transcriptional regulator with XRE-family HTH domain